MWTFVQALAAIFQFSILGLIFYLIFKYGKIRTVTQINYVYKRWGNELTISYKKFNSFEYYYFRLKKQETVTVKYEVTVEEGSLTLEWRDSKDLIFSETFTENTQGEFTFTTKLRLHSLKLEAEQTRGGCFVELIR